MKNPEQYQHPSYGLIGISRRSGSAHLFGSSLDRHYNTLTITINRATFEHDLNHDTYYQKEELIEVELSAAQFADFLSVHNTMPGTPCTIRHIKGERRIPDPPALGNEVSRVKNDFVQKMAELSNKLAEFKAKVDLVTSKGTSTKAERQAAAEAADHMMMEIRSNIPFVLESFDEASTKVIQSAKAEIDAAMNKAITIVGTDTLRQYLPPASATPELQPSDSE